MAPIIVDKEQKKLEILHAAMEVFASKGLVNTKMIDIARAAKIGKGTIYEYYRNKEDIFSSAFNAMFTEMQDLLPKIVNSSQSPDEKLHHLIDTLLASFMHGNGKFAAIMMDFWAEGIRTKDETISNTIDLGSIYEQYRTLIKSIIDEGIEKKIFRSVDSLSLASVIIGTLDGVVLQWIIHPDVVDLNKVYNIIFDVLIHGIQVEQSV